MKPLDIVVLLKKMTSKGASMTGRGLAESLGVSASSVSESLNRCKKAQLLDQKKQRVNTLALQEFLIHGVSYVFPAEVGRVVRGIPTYVSAAPFKELLSEDGRAYVWHYSRGTSKGQQIPALCPCVPEAVQRDSELCELLVIVDVLRMGRVREKEIAVQELSKRFAQYAENQ